MITLSSGEGGQPGDYFTQSLVTGATEGSAAPLEFRHVTKRYGGLPVPALNDLSLSVPAGEVCVLVGPSGCGKTTAMRLVNRMIDLTSGDILIDGASIAGRQPADLRREIGYVIQHVGLFPHMTILHNMTMVPRLLGWDRKRIAERGHELLDLIGLPQEMASRYPGQLSGGQRQRVGVARALAADPPLMLMDEPFGAIDPINRGRLQNEFLRLQKEIRKTIVFVTHDIDEAIKMGDRIAILRDGGELVQYDTPDAILADPADEFVAEFVGVDRGLKRLALATVETIDLDEAPVVREGESVPPSAERGTVIVVDGERRPLGQLPRDRASTGPVGASDAEPVQTVGVDASLRTALSMIMTGELQPLVVVDREGRVAGLVSIELINRAVQEVRGDRVADDVGATQ
jgi:osmoprotectant transport system ATP-binding protein